ncbi:DUF2079 domain-containing protein [Streptomyces purpureus]|nr:DUF2079 domain-containing protein [Streptomyces purpureus]
MQLGGFDLGIFDQAIRSYAAFSLPVSPVKNYHHEFPADFSLLGDHFSPILALAAPLYWVWDDPRVLLVLQAALFAAGAPLVRGIAARALARAGSAPDLRFVNACAFVYAVGWPLMTAARGGFHEVAFAVPLTLAMFHQALARRYTMVLVTAFLLTGVKEDLGLVVGCYGVVLLVRSGRARDMPGLRTGAALAIAGPVRSPRCRSRG